MRKKDEALRDTLLALAHEIVSTHGSDALNIRKLAQEAGVASGTVYNYFACKDDILLAITEDYWRKTLLAMRGKINADSFPAQIREIFSFLKSRVSDSAGMLMGSLSNVEAVGRQRMQSMQEALRASIVERMRGDARIKPSVWDKTLTEEQFADFVITSMMSLLRMNAPNIDPFVEIINRIVYEGE